MMRKFNRLSLLRPNRTLGLVAAAVAVAFLAGCSHRQQAAYTPPPPPLASTSPESTAPPSTAPATRPEYPGSPSLSADDEYVATHSPILTQTGLASWYGPPYNNRAGANGKIYNEDDISAAHRTLPMGSLIRVTNLRTGQSAVMRITDRGPFVAGRILDLSVGAAKAVGLWRAGVGEVRIDVYSTPEPLDSGGRWCVQIGAFSHLNAARHLQTQLEREYSTANVIEFEGPTGYWVRIRPEGDNRTVATTIARSLRPSEGEAWLVRLD